MKVASWFVWVIASLAPALAWAHTIPGGLTLNQMARASDVIAVARITRPGDEPRGGGPLPPVEAEVTELLREGDAKKGRVRFIPHRHADETYAAGEEVLLFLAKKRGEGGEAYHAIEAIADRVVLTAETRARWIEAARAYAALGKGSPKSADPAQLGRVTVAMLASEEPRIASLALRDLLLAGDAPVVGASDVPALSAIVDDAARPAAHRLGVLMELERRKLVPIGPRWVKLLRAVEDKDRVAVVRAAASRAFVPEVSAELVAILDRGEREAAVAAARALGAAGNDAAVEALGRAVDREPDELRFAALGSLRRIGTDAARALLSRAASSHPDPETRRTAATEQNLLPPAASAAPTSASEPPAEPAPEGRGAVTWLVLALALVVGLGALFGSLTRKGKTS